MIRLLPRRFRGQPRIPLTAVGHGRIHHEHLPAKTRKSLGRFVDTTPQQWGLLFVLDGRGRRWTLYSPDPDYTALFAPTAHTLDLTFDVFASKFPCWNTEWHVT
ncbi:hypothetical protein [Actinoplanes sp. L3-i22]|uniref:hypothetical protein n=1 Tax=Actinoplanes sp. L3-i22 TaxID=2836373 RepID=UPI001C79246A|nr:hypothetical protein [Actinoplanes sp. L3-i22]BCY10952.1 hypothetical protein L3i22_060400 [Actinoplanes sp. L3-i22]